MIGALLATAVGLGTAEIVVALAIVVVGAAVQGSIGIGLGLVAAPVLALVDADFLPISVVVAVVPLGVGVIARDHALIAWNEVAVAILGRMPGVTVGAWLVHRMGANAISIVIGISVLLAVAGSLTSRRFRPTRRNLAIAGFASGITGTAAGIGGPPMALTYQHADGRVLRATLAAYFAIGGAISFAALAVGGDVGERELRLAALVIPGSLAGLVLSRVVIRRLPPEALRPILLVACTLSATVLIVETFL